MDKSRPGAALRAALFLSCLATAGGASAQSTQQELKDRLEQLEREMSEIRRLIEETGQKADQADQKAEAAVVAIEEGGGAGAASWAERTHIGGYGELHYNNLDADDPANDTDEIDFHRFVLLFGHEFNDRLRLNTELELEHALTVDTDDGSGPGEVELEQAYVEYDINNNLRSKAGVFLMPHGILNETHEPPTFYGVERNDVENIIIPSTWWEGGVGIGGNTGAGLNWDLGFHSGLEIPTEGGSAFRVRSGRGKLGKQTANNFALSGRVGYNGLPGLQLGASFNYQDDPSQQDGDGLDDGVLFTTHGIWTAGDFQVRALYGRWDFSGAAVEAAGADEQDGWYIEPSYKLTEKWGVYTRYEDIDAARSQDKFSQWEAGVNFWPHPDVVLKADFRSRDHDLAAEKGRDFDGFDLGVGYQF